ncbi:MAG: hypothetical protein HYS21_12495 [Deltaproteobacteria bacterium]|nr:hypothetical protein [Deltaproteobacteria bacterium]
MDPKELDELKRKVDNILDIYFEELICRFEEKRDIQGMTGWLRASIHDVIIKGLSGRESRRNKYVYHATIAVLLISILNLILVSLRYVVDQF